MMILQNIGIDWTDRKLIWNLYNKQVAYVRIEDGLSTACTIGRGVRQGCSLSPLLYLIYDEAMIRETTDNMETGISVGSHIINTIRYADDKTVVANSQKGLQQLIDNLNKVTREFSMKISVKKTKVMCISHKRNNKLKIYVDGQQVEQVSQFR